MADDDKKPDDNKDTKDTFTKADVEKLLSERETAIKTEFESHIKKLNKENQDKRLSEKELKEAIAKALNLNPDDKTDKDIISEKLAELTKTQKELADKLEQAEKAKTRLEKQNLTAEALEKAGFQKKALKLIDLEGDLEEQIKQLEIDYPELKVKKGTGTGSNPGDPGNTVTVNPYKAESRNLTLQYKLEQSNPALALKFKAEAGVK